MFKNRVRYKHKLFMERDFIEAWELKKSNPKEENINRFNELLDMMPLLLPVKNDEEIPVLIMENGERYLPLLTNEKRKVGDIGGIVDYMVTKFDVVKYLALREDAGLDGLIINPRDEAIKLTQEEIKDTIKFSWVCI